ncbi:MAG: HAD family phosphatase [Rikenellaceae bacterium]|nr:HAD family phosphatase [Rikenellaceae bacterium]
MLQNIKQVIFDLGGVIVDLEMERVRECFRQIGMPRMAALMDPCYPAEVNERMERGEITWEEACDEMRRIDNRPDVTNEQIEWVYREFLARVDSRKIELIEQLRARGLKLYILSNTNRVAFDAVRRHFAAAGRKIEDCFDGIFLSYEMKLLKPAPEIFQEVIRRMGITPEETLFIDDGARNADAGHAAGFQVYCPPTNGSFAHLFAE